ncbi:hypothetical protein FI667_g3506, partial [Globisporangium splendens]
MATTKNATRVSEDERLSTASTHSSTSMVAYGSAAAEEGKSGRGSVASFFCAVTSKFKKHDGIDRRDLEAFLWKLCLSLDFAAAVLQPPLSLFEDATVCMRALDRVQTFCVRSNEKHKSDDGLPIVVDLTIKPKQHQVAQPNDIFVANMKPKRATVTAWDQDLRGNCGDEEKRPHEQHVVLFVPGEKSISASYASSERCEQLGHFESSAKPGRAAILPSASRARGHPLRLLQTPELRAGQRV